MAGNFIEQIKKRREAAENPAPEPETKPTDEMTDTELEDAITAARRQLLDAQHRELREREIARVQGATPPPDGERRTLAGVLHEKQRGKRRTWR
jgi:hypothetical protein